MSSMNITVNGKRHMAESLTLVALLRENGITENSTGVAVAVNSNVVPKRAWDSVRLSDGDVIEIINAVQGG
jgi:sulfur carrier protein